MVSMKGRLDRVFSKAKVQSILIINTDNADSNFIYFTGFQGGLFEGCILLVQRKSMILFVSPLEYGLAKSQKPKEMKIVLLNKRHMLRDILKKELKGKKVGINGAFLPYNTYKGLSAKVKAKFVDVSEQLLLARLVKDETEIRAMKKAVSITKKAIEAGKASLKSGITEKEVAGVIDTTMMKMGATPAFTSIVAFDSNSALPHHSPSSDKLKPNGIVLIDVGAKVDNYCGDMTRTFMFRPNKKSDKYRKFSDMYSVVSKAQQIGLSKIKENAPAGTAHIAAAKYIDQYNKGVYKGKFIHSLGHSIGIDVHDGAGLWPGSKLKLKRNMIFSDEPGVYIEGFGGVRIEDDVLVGKRSSFM